MNWMELFARFMHYYFWVYLISVSIAVIANWNKKEPERYSVTLEGAVAITLWLMSWAY